MKNIFVIKLLNSCFTVANETMGAIAEYIKMQ